MQFLQKGLLVVYRFAALPAGFYAPLHD